jgi:DNA-binding NtrC family response regulator
LNPPKPLRVFVVDDERVIANTLALILRKNGYSAEPFSSPLEALNSAESDRPDILLSDVMMHECSGVELAIRIKEICPDCIVLLISGQASIANLLEAAGKKGFDFPLYPKPIHPAALLQELTRLTSQPQLR